MSIGNAYENLSVKKQNIEGVPGWESGIERNLIVFLKTIEATKFCNSDEKVPVEKEALMMQEKDLEKARWDRV